MERDLERGPPGPQRPPLGPPLSSSIGLALLLLLLALIFWLYITMSNWTGGALLVLYSFALILIIIILIIFIFRRDLLCPLGGLGLLLLMSKYYTLSPNPLSLTLTCLTPFLLFPQSPSCSSLSGICTDRHCTLELCCSSSPAYLVRSNIPWDLFTAPSLFQP